MGTFGLFRGQQPLYGRLSSWGCGVLRTPLLAAPEAGQSPRPRALTAPLTPNTPCLHIHAQPGGVWSSLAPPYWACTDQHVCAEEVTRSWRSTGSGGQEFHLQLSAHTSHAQHNAWQPDGHSGRKEGRTNHVALGCRASINRETTRSLLPTGTGLSSRKVRLGCPQRTFTEASRCARHWAKSFTSSISFNPAAEGRLLSSCYRWENRHKEVTELAQGHTGSK